MSQNSASMTGQFAQDARALVEHEDQRIAHYLKWSRRCVFALVIGVGGWASMTSLDGAVIASGKVTVEANSKSIQHLDGGIITKLAVRDGQLVKAGELLLTLDPGRVDDKMDGLRSQSEAKKRQLELLRSELEDLEALAEKKLVPRSQLASTQREVAQLEGEAGRVSAELARLSTDKGRLEVRAPISGRVHKLAVHTIGGVVAPGKEMLQIVPSDALLVLEVQVSPQDIDQVRGGQDVAIRLSSFNQRTTPELEGVVVNVSADLVADERQGTFHYLAQVRLNEGQIERLGGKPLLPGMPADVFIKTDSRTVMSYLLKPLTDQFERALREE